MAEGLSFHKKRRKVVRVSLTKLSTKVTDLEGSPTALGRCAKPVRIIEDTWRGVQGTSTKNHRPYGNREDEEQQALDDNDDIVSELNIRIQRLVTLATPPVGTDTKKMVTKQLTLLTSKLKNIEMSINALEDDEDGLCALEEHRDQVVEIKKELSGVKTSLLKSDATTEDPVMQDHTIPERNK